MTPSLDGARAKVERAKEHLDALDREWQAFVQLYPDGATPDHTFDGVWHIITVSPLFDEPPPLRLGLICGDVIHNLRCALDYIIWQLVLREGNQPTKSNAFPISKSPEGFKELLSKRESDKNPLYGIECDAVLRIIDEVQPYKRRELGEDPLGSPLEIVRRLSNIDKHRTLLEHTYQSTAKQIAEVYGYDPRAQLLESHGGIREVSHEHETEIARLRFSQTGPDPQLYVKGDLTVNPMFGGAAARNEDAIHVSLGILKDIPVYVSGIIGKFQVYF